MKDGITIAGGDTAQPINTARRVAVVSRSAAGFHQPRFLDCGCGAGSHLPHSEALGWQVSGLEFMPEKIAAARAAGLGEDKVVQRDLEALPFASESFDILLFNEVLEHVPSDEAALAEAHRVLKPGGLLLVFSPNRLYPFESHGVLLKQQEQKVKVTVWTPFIPYIPLSIGRRFFH
jgi:SAM-dependent methyltransferase